MFILQRGLAVFLTCAGLVTWTPTFPPPALVPNSIPASSVGLPIDPSSSSDPPEAAGIGTTVDPFGLASLEQGDFLG